MQQVLFLAISCLCALSVQGCAPYFQTQQWRDVEPYFQNNTNCGQRFLMPPAGVEISGEDYCLKVLAGRSYCYNLCLNNWAQYCKVPAGNDTGATEITVKHINCPKMRQEGDGTKAYQIFFNCICDVKAKFLNRTDTYTSCQSPEVVWLAVEQSYNQSCPNPFALAPTPLNHSLTRRRRYVIQSEHY